jgi:hypothetical protein
MEEMVERSTGGDQDAINTFMAGKVRPCVSALFFFTKNRLDSSMVRASACQSEMVGGFLEKSACPPSIEGPLKYESASYFSPANYANNLDSCGEYSLHIWIKGFSFIPQFTNINEPI